MPGVHATFLWYSQVSAIGLSPRPSFRFSEGLVPRLANARELSNMYFMAVWVGVSNLWNGLWNGLMEWTDGMD